MPYELKKSGKGWLVVSKDTGKSHSNSPLPRDRAEAQMRALYAAMERSGENVKKK